MESGTEIRYVAIGDSFSEGVGDERPDGVPRGWADRVAELFARPVEGTEPSTVHYANLAVRGKLLPSILADQLPAALALDPLPTHLSFNGGANDIMRPGFDRRGYIAGVRALVRRCQDAGVAPIILSGADASTYVPLGRVLRRRAVDLIDATAEMCEELGCTFVDVFADPVLRAAGYWSGDRVHLNAAGHEYTAVVVAASQSVPCSVPERLPMTTDVRSFAREVAYYREHVAPWVSRRLRGRSSGDGRPPKIGAWTPVLAATVEPIVEPVAESAVGPAADAAAVAAASEVAARASAQAHAQAQAQAHTQAHAAAPDAGEPAAHSPRPATVPVS